MIQHNNIHLFEEHSSTLPFWWDQHDSPQTVVYLDAHLDLQQTGADSLSALKACNTLEEVQALEAPSHLNPSTRYAFGIENFLYAAHELNLIERLIWVSPPHIPRHYSSALIEYAQQMDGISFDELTGFQKIGRNALRGTLLGLDITICDYDDLDSLDINEDYYLDIDIDYFVEVPSDRLWIDPATVINKIMTQLGEPSIVTISRAVSSGFMPLAFRFVGDYIYSLMKGQTDESDYYQNLTAAIHDMSDGKLSQGRSACERLIKEQPELAHAYYMLALSSADTKQKNRLLEKAASCDSAYQFDLARETIGLLHRKKPLNENTLQQLTTTLNRMELQNPLREEAEVALAQVLAACGNLESAQSLVRRQTGDYVDHEDVLLSISASQLENPTKREQNKVMLNKISNGVKNATAAAVYLGDLEFADKNYHVALKHYLSAQSRAPAWMLPLERLLVSYQKLGRDEKASNIEQEITRRKQRLKEILTRT